MILKRWTRVIVWNEPELVYLRVPKAANSSIRSSLPGGVQKRLDIRKLARRYPRHLSFSFVRNPWARLVSIFSEKLRPEPVNDFYFVDGVHRCFVKHRLPVRAGMPFEEFAELACSLSDDETEKHLKSQIHFLLRDGAIIPQFLGRVESIDDDWRRLAALAGFEAPLGHHNRSRHTPYTGFYDHALANRVGDRYRSDVETFGYDFKPDPPTRSPGICTRATDVGRWPDTSRAAPI